MATAGEYTIGTNAGVPILNYWVEQFVPSFWQGNFTNEMRAQLVAQIVTASLDAVDKYRKGQTP